MDSTAETKDDQPDRTLPQPLPDSTAVYENPQTNSSLDSGIETGDQTDSNANYEAPATNATTDSSNAPPLVEAQLAEEQELTPDVRARRLRNPMRHRGRLIDFLTGAR